MTDSALHSEGEEARWPVALLAASVAAALTLLAFDPHMFGDEGIWHYVGSRWLRGDLLPYRDMVENKPPAVFLVYGLQNLLFGATALPLRLAGAALLVVRSLLLYRMGRTLRDETAGRVALLLAGLTAGWDLLNGQYLAMTDVFLSVFLVAAYDAVLRSARAATPRRSRRGLLAAGAFFGLALSFKQIAVASAPGLLLFHLALRRREEGAPRVPLPRAMLLFLLAAAAVHALSLLPFLLSGGTLALYAKGAWAILLTPASGAISLYERVNQMTRVWIFGRMRFFYPFLVYFVWRHRTLRARGVPVAGLAAWLLFDTLGANASGFTYHRLHLLVPSFALVAGIAASLFLETHSSTSRPRRTRTRLALLLLLLLWFPYQNCRWVLRRIAHGYVDPRKGIGEWLRERTDPSDTIYAYGTGYAPVYVYADRRAASRYFISLNEFVPGETYTVAVELRRTPPRYIVTALRMDRMLPRYLRNILDGAYERLGPRGAYVIYRRRPGVERLPPPPHPPAWYDDPYRRRKRWKTFERGG